METATKGLHGLLPFQRFWSTNAKDYIALSFTVSEILVNRHKTLCILHQWYEKCIQYNLELAHKAKMME